MSTKAQRTTARKQVVGWTERSRKLRDAYHLAGSNRAKAMTEALELGVPIKTVAADADVDVSFVSRAVKTWCENEGRPRPDPNVYAINHQRPVTEPNPTKETTA